MRSDCGLRLNGPSSSHSSLGTRWDMNAVYLMVVGLKDLGSSCLSLGMKLDMEGGISES